MSGNNTLAKPKPITLKKARDLGLLIETIPLDQIDPNYLVRDRLLQDEDEMASLKVSLKTRGQQMPIEVAAPGAASAKYGLISGWRRLMALRELLAETDDPQFAEIKALVITPDTAQDAYLAMIEENEIRVNLSFYERARIALRSVHEGVFPDTKTALRHLYASSTRSKRSKIGTFVSLVDSFDGVLQHPTAISEKLGLALAREIVRDGSFAERVADRLRKAPVRSEFEEIRMLSQAVTTPPPAVEQIPTAPVKSERRKAKPSKTHREKIGTLTLRYRPDTSVISLAGVEVDDAFFDDLKTWIEARTKKT